MDDEKIVSLYFDRDETAIEETRRKYLHYLMKISVNVLGDPGEAEECVNDTYMKAWQSIPPERPASLAAYLGTVIRRISVSRLRRRNAGKRGGTEYDLSLEELGECVPLAGDPSAVEEEVDRAELGRAISRFLHSLPPLDRRVFTGRYFFFDSVREVADYCGVSPSKVRRILDRTREELRDSLEAEGFGKY